MALLRSDPASAESFTSALADAVKVLVPQTVVDHSAIIGAAPQPSRQRKRG